MKSRHRPTEERFIFAIEVELKKQVFGGNNIRRVM